ncbi:MAG: 4-hydroxy-tetrahydrodipicolinate synthase [Bacteroidales bacterium]|nr:4-hydroxy-tetrahydrodipicolinate synthase [Bacteroidales bacterium]MDZ4203933.1 4-hydroxy-tetrahydrodipicolinate synthase [Bacteroidales bacterium]
MEKKFKGTGVAIITPFHKHGTIDHGAMERMIEHTISNKVEYIVLMGTTGESATLSKDEKNALLNFTIETINHRVPLVVGIGGNNTQDIVDSITSKSFEGVDAILSVAPYYNKPQQLGIYYHYKHIATACPVPIIIYNVPGRTSVNISAETTLKLAHDFENIIGIKEASGNLTQCMQIIKNKPKNFLVISGDDILTLPLLALGADGVISVVANAFPLQFSEMVRLGLKGDFAKARQIHYQLSDFIETLFVDGSPAGIKAALEIMGLAPNNLRLPVVKVNKEVYIKLSAQIKTLTG